MKGLEFYRLLQVFRYNGKRRLVVALVACTDGVRGAPALPWGDAPTVKDVGSRIVWYKVTGANTAQFFKVSVEIKWSRHQIDKISFW